MQGTITGKAELSGRQRRFVDAYLGPEGVLTGSARLAQEAKERSASVLREREGQRKLREIERKRLVVDAQIAILRAALESDEDTQQFAEAEEQARLKQQGEDRNGMASSRKADPELTKRGVV